MDYRIMGDYFFIFIKYYGWLFFYIYEIFYNEYVLFFKLGNRKVMI